MDTPCQSNPEKWFSEEIKDVKEACFSCRGCPMQMQCLEQGLFEEYGVWGGVSSYKRRVLRRRVA